MLEYRPFILRIDNSTEDLPGACALTPEEAENKVQELVNANVGRRSFLDVSDPSKIQLAFCDDPDGEVGQHAFIGSQEEVHRLKIFAMRYKAKKKRQENIDKN
jgi:hypothetical protein